MTLFVFIKDDELRSVSSDRDICQQGGVSVDVTLFRVCLKEGCRKRRELYYEREKLGWNNDQCEEQSGWRSR